MSGGPLCETAAELKLCTGWRGAVLVTRLLFWAAEAPVAVLNGCTRPRDAADDAVVARCTVGFGTGVFWVSGGKFAASCSSKGLPQS